MYVLSLFSIFTCNCGLIPVENLGTATLGGKVEEAEEMKIHYFRCDIIKLWRLAKAASALV